MPLSQIVRKTCDVCGKIAVETTRIDLGTTRLIILQCGHTTTEEKMNESTDIATVLNGCTLMPYQVDGVKFLESASARALLADEQGLGKTIQVLALLKLHPELLPVVICCPTTVRQQWHHEIRTKCGVHGFLTQVISSGKELAAPGFDIYVTSYDLLKNEKCFDLVKDKIKTVVIDECQRIKDHLSGRAKAVQNICKYVEHIIPLSGTPIKNNAGEYFTVLNLIQPRMFPAYSRFIEEECDSYQSAYGYKVGGLRNPSRFAEKTKDFILRRVKSEVLKDLPSLSRRFFHVPLDGKVKKAYMEAISELEDLMYDENADSIQSAANKIAVMTKMRQIAGISKVDPCVDYVIQFLLSSERKITIFAHHHVVTEMVIAKLNQWLKDGGYLPVLHMSAALSGDDRQAMAVRFANEPYRVMVASTLAAGEGLNLQFCSDAIMLERQWNPANEEQAEGRFHRYGQENPVTVEYMIVSETIDEYFTELVESKRAIVAAALDNREIQWDQASLMKELAEILVTKGKKAWKM